MGDKGFSQTILTADFFDVTTGEGKGMRFDAVDDAKISMGNSDLFHYGPVTSTSIKSNIFGYQGCGWTWGLNNQQPIASLSNTGNMQLAGDFVTVGRIGLGSSYIGPLAKMYIYAYNQRGFEIDHFQAGPYDYNMLIYENNEYTKTLAIVDKATHLESFVLWANGNIFMHNLAAQSIKVRPDPWTVIWPDFVFNDDYKKSSLSDLDLYIKEKKHLPGIPTQSEIQKDGYDLQKMDALLLQKIEEITLYMIELKNENEALKKLINCK